VEKRRGHRVVKPLFKWCSVSVDEVIATGYRLEAGVYDIEARQAREILQKSKYPLRTLCGADGFATAYYLGRFKRIYVDKSDYPIYNPSQINELYPLPANYIASKTPVNYDSLKLQKGQVVLTRSGTIGDCAYVGKTFAGLAFSDDLLRINALREDEAGYIFAYLRSRTGQLLLRTSNYGAVVSHIEPEHLEHLHVPDANPDIKKEIHEKIVQSYDLRDESNVLLDQAQAVLRDTFELPPIEALSGEDFLDCGVRNLAQ
jgi:type I restriction enzyme, S subunit